MVAKNPKKKNHFAFPLKIDNSIIAIPTAGIIPPIIDKPSNTGPLNALAKSSINALPAKRIVKHTVNLITDLTIYGIQVLSHIKDLYFSFSTILS